MTDRSASHASSEGQAYAATPWLDARYVANRAEYEAQLRAVGFALGARVLDAGCGSGSYLPLLAELVGPAGMLDALDLAPENIAAVEGRLVDWGLERRVVTRVGSVLALPYPDGTFDAAWCANTSQYLSDAGMQTALAELRRVVRPGGLVAVKDSDSTLNRCLPAPPGLIPRTYLALAERGGVEEHGTLRAATLPAWLRRAGLAQIRRHTTLIERDAPLPPPTKDQFRDFFAYYASRTEGLGLSPDDEAFWAGLREPSAPDRFLDDPDFYFCEGSTLAFGRVPVE